MYLPNIFEEDRRDVMYALMRARPFATLVTTGEAGIIADHLPVEIAEPQGVEVQPRCIVRGHVARANSVWRDYQSGSEALVIFQGPHAYISPSLYATKALTGEVVPTWDYAVVHARGVLNFTHDADWLRALVSRLTDAHETTRAHPWKIGDAPTAYMEKMLGAIVGFELSVVSLTGKWKVSQNRSMADQRGVIDGLRADSNSDARQIATMLADTQDPVTTK